MESFEQRQILSINILLDIFELYEHYHNCLIDAIRCNKPQYKIDAYNEHIISLSNLADEQLAVAPEGIKIININI